MTDQDVVSALTRTARRHGWTEVPVNSLDYYTQTFTRPETGSRCSVLRVRVTNRIVDARIEIGGSLRQSFTMPTLRQVVGMLEAPPPQPVAIHPPSDPAGHDLTALREAVRDWNSGLDRHGHALYRAADELLRRADSGGDA